MSATPGRIAELDVVVVTHDIGARGLEAGDIRTVVHGDGDRAATGEGEP